MVRKHPIALGVAALLLVAGTPALAGSPASAAAAPAAAAPTVPADAREFEQQCGGTSWVAGSTNVCDGTLVYRDYVYDDTGRDTGDIGYSRGTQRAYGTLAHPAGDLRYAPDATQSADLVSLSLTRVGDRIDVLAEMNALYTPGSTVLAIAVDTDGDQATGGGAWPDLGVTSAGWDEIYRIDQGDPATNLMRGSFPLPSAASFHVEAVTAQAATGEVMNVAFRGVDESASYRIDHLNPSPYLPSGQGAWFEDDQAAALADGDISAFGVDVAAADLQPGVTRLHKVGPGLHERVYTSAFTLDRGEGLSYAGIRGRGDGGSTTAFSQVFNFLGKYQPYGIFVPDTAGPHGMQMEWHGSNQGIVAQINQPGMQADFGTELNRVLITPLARGPNGYGSDISERDLLDVMDDMLAHYPIDRDRVFSSGYSQGGYIGFRMAMLHPDRFAGFTAWVGFTGNDSNGTPARGTVDVTAGAVGNMVDYTRNLRHVPGSMIYALQDELVQAPSALAMERSFAATDNVYDWYMHSPADHFTFITADDWQKEADDSKDLTLVRNPARVSFRTDAFLDAPQLGIVHDRAYWVSEIRQADEGFADTDLTSHGCGTGIPETKTANSAGPRPVPWVSSSRERTGTTPLPAQQLLEGTLSNVASLRLDLAAMCLRDGFSYAIETSTPAVLRLPDGRELALQAGRNTGTFGAPATAAPAAGGAVPASGAGSSTASSTGSSTGSSTAAARGTLAATGSPAGVALLALAAGAAAAAVRRRPDRG
jgi:pimeloyl-ACP methyl ester carboxylesterase